MKKMTKKTAMKTKGGKAVNAPIARGGSNKNASYSSAFADAAIKASVNTMLSNVLELQKLLNVKPVTKNHINQQVLDRKTGRTISKY